MSRTLAREAPERIGRPLMTHDWNQILFIHWPVEPRRLAPLLPDGLEPDLIDGQAYVGVIPFLLTVRPLNLGWAVVRDAPEINLRTYVRGPDGGCGIHFLSLELGELWAATFARHTYRLPYRWSAMGFRREGARLAYSSQRRRRGLPCCRLEVEVGEAIPVEREQPLDRFLTARWRLYSGLDRLLLRAQVEHPPWELHSARLLHLEQDLLPAAGLPQPTGLPHLLYSPGTTVVFGPPRLLKHRPAPARNMAGSRLRP